MKKLMLTISLLFLIGCGGSNNSNPTTNQNIYNLRLINTLAPFSGLLKGSYSNGVTGSIFLSKLNDGNDFLDGVKITKMKNYSSITLDNGITSESTSFSLVDENGFTRAFNDTLSSCSLITTPKIISTSAQIGDSSSEPSIYSCDDGSKRTISWKLVDAGSGNANYIFDTIITGTLQSENQSTLTITANNKIIYSKIFVNLIAKNITGTFEGNIK